jgi:hypothetical protein
MTEYHAARERRRQAFAKYMAEEQAKEQAKKTSSHKVTVSSNGAVQTGDTRLFANTYKEAEKRREQRQIQTPASSPKKENPYAKYLIQKGPPPRPMTKPTWRPKYTKGPDATDRRFANQKEDARVAEQKKQKLEEARQERFKSEERVSGTLVARKNQTQRAKARSDFDASLQNRPAEVKHYISKAPEREYSHTNPRVTFAKKEEPRYKYEGKNYQYRDEGLEKIRSGAPGHKMSNGVKSDSKDARLSKFNPWLHRTNSSDDDGISIHLPGSEGAKMVEEQRRTRIAQDLAVEIALTLLGAPFGQLGRIKRGASLFGAAASSMGKKTAKNIITNIPKSAAINAAKYAVISGTKRKK